MRNNIISSGGLYSIFFVSSMTGAFMFVSSSRSEVANSDLILLPLAFTLILVITSIPIMVYVKRFKSVGILDACTALSPAAGKITALLYCGIFILGSVRTVSRLDLFVSSVIFPEVDMSVYMLVVVAACAFASSYGLAALGKMGKITAVFFVIASVVILVSLKGELDFLNLTPLFADNPSSFLNASVLTASYAVEVALIPLLLPRLTGNKVKGFYMWLLASYIGITVFAFVIVTALGFYANTQIFPTFTLSALGEIGLFQRLDAIETAVWILGIVVKLALFLKCSSMTLCYAFTGMGKRTALIICSIITGLSVVYISQNIMRFTFFISPAQTAISYGLLVVAIPVAVITADAIKGSRRRYEKKAS